MLVSIVGSMILIMANPPAEIFFFALAVPLIFVSLVTTTADKRSKFAVTDKGIIVRYFLWREDIRRYDANFIKQNAWIINDASPSLVIEELRSNVRINKRPVYYKYGVLYHDRALEVAEQFGVIGFHNPNGINFGKTLSKLFTRQV